MNISNFAIATGRLVEDPKVFKNRDGSRNVVFHVAVSNNYKEKDGHRGSQFLPFEAFVYSNSVTKNDDGSEYLGVFSRIHKGDKVSVQYTVRNNNYKDKEGNNHYELILFVEQISLEESKSVTERRLLQRICTVENDNTEIN